MLPAQVSVSTADGGVLAETDATGAFELPLPPGAHLVQVMASGHLPRLFWE